MTPSRRRLGLQPRFLDSSSSSNSQFWVLRTFVFEQRERRILVVEVSTVPSLGPHHREEREIETVGRGET
jgi:hypothetical protein